MGLLFIVIYLLSPIIRARAAFPLSFQASKCLKYQADSPNFRLCGTTKAKPGDWR